MSLNTTLAPGNSTVAPTHLGDVGTYTADYIGLVMVGAIFFIGFMFMVLYMPAWYRRRRIHLHTHDEILLNDEI